MVLPGRSRLSAARHCPSAASQRAYDERTRFDVVWCTLVLGSVDVFADTDSEETYLFPFFHEFHDKLLHGRVPSLQAACRGAGAGRSLLFYARIEK